jgi:hypothetical protein
MMECVAIWGRLRGPTDTTSRYRTYALLYTADGASDSLIAPYLIYVKSGRCMVQLYFQLSQLSI